MILTVTLNPALDETLYVDGLKPHDTNRILRIETDAGGKGVNLSRVAAELGADTTATGFLGGRAGRFIRRVLQEQGVVDAFLASAGETRTVWSIESGDGPPTTFNGKGSPVSQEQWEHLCDRVAGLARTADWLCLGGSLPAGVPPNAYAVLGQIGRDAGTKVLIDADGPALTEALAFGPDLVKPNRAEAERLLSIPLESEEAVLMAAQKIRDRLMERAADPIALVSLGAEGVVMAWSGGCRWFPAFKVVPKSTIGSGDSMLAGFLVGLQRGESPEQAIRLGLAAGAATAESTGCGIARRAEVERLLG